MSGRMAAAVAWLDARPPRERFLMLATAMVALYVVWSALVLAPLEAERSRLAAALGESTTRVQALEQESSRLAARLAESPDAENRRALARLTDELAALEARLAAFDLGVVSPAEAARVLEELVQDEHGLRLVRLEALPPRPAFAAGSAGAPDAPAALAPPAGSVPRGPVLYRHDLEIVLEGGYLPTLHYLQALQRLPWRLYWDDLTYTVTEHPTGRVVLRVHTLGLEEAWLGV